VTRTAALRQGGQIDETSPDVVPLDLRMPRMDGIATLRELNQRATMPAVLVLTNFDDDDAVPWR
jgi:DNA-binding NarL/FixJ family response regulator